MQVRQGVGRQIQPQNPLATIEDEEIVQELSLRGEEGGEHGMLRGHPGDVVGHQALQELHPILSRYLEDRTIGQMGGRQWHGRESLDLGGLGPKRPAAILSRTGPITKRGGQASGQPS